MEDREKLMKEIWTTFHPKLQVYLKQLFPSTRDVEERVSEILLKVFDNLDSYNPKYALSTWIYRVARNSQIDEIRRVSPEIHQYDDEKFTHDENPEELFFKKYDSELIKLSIKSLKPALREVIYFYYYEEMTYREISEVTGEPEGTLKFRMSTARKELKIKLEKECRV